VEHYSPLAQLVERVTVNHHVRGSSPRWGAIQFKGLQLITVGPFLFGVTFSPRGCFPLVIAPTFPPAPPRSRREPHCFALTFQIPQQSQPRLWRGLKMCGRFTFDIPPNSSPRSSALEETPGHHSRYIYCTIKQLQVMPLPSISILSPC
jgi:hypothetical protein